MVFIDRSLSDTYYITCALCLLSCAVAEMGDCGHNRHGPKRGGLLCPFRRELYNVAWTEVYFRNKWRLHPSSRLATIDTNQKLGAVPLLGGAATPLAQRLATIDMGQKLGRGCALFWGGELGSHRTQSPRPRPTSIPSGIQPFGHNGHWPKIGGCAPTGGGTGSPSNTMSPRLRPIPPCEVASESFQPFRYNRHGPKIGWRNWVPIEYSLLGRGLPPYQVAS